jgi:hypothetical protein
MKAVLTAMIPAALVAVSLGAIAKLPPAPPLEGAKAEEKKAKDAAAAALTAAQQAKAEDRAVAHYLQQLKARGKTVTPQMAPNAAELETKAREASAKAAAVTGAAPVAASAPAAPAQSVSNQQAAATEAAPKK